MSNTNYASPFLRLLASLIDQLIGVAIFFLVIMPVFSALSTEKILDAILGGFIILFYIGITLPIINAYLTARLGGTLGKLIAGLIVQNEDGNLVSFKRALFRTYVGYSAAMVFMGAGYFYTFVDQKRRGFHDLVTGTVVVKVNTMGVILGILVLTGLSLANLMLIRNIVTKVIENKDTYSQIIEDVNYELDSKSGEGYGEDKSSQELPVVPGDKAKVFYVNSKYPFIFEHPLYYTVYDSTTEPNFVDITLENELDEDFSEPIILIKTEPIYVPYAQYTDGIWESICSNSKNWCSVPNTGSDYFIFESKIADIYFYDSYIPGKNEGIVYNIKMQGQLENKEFTTSERASYREIVDSFKFTN